MVWRCWHQTFVLLSIVCFSLLACSFKRLQTPNFTFSKTTHLFQLSTSHLMHIPPSEGLFRSSVWGKQARLGVIIYELKSLLPLLAETHQIYCLRVCSDRLCATYSRPEVHRHHTYEVGSIICCSGMAIWAWCYRQWRCHCQLQNVWEYKILL